MCRAWILAAADPFPLLPPSETLQPKVYNRDAKELGELPKGDMYIRDLKNTKGEPSPRKVALLVGLLS